MAIELSNLTFTEQDDIVPQSGVEEIVNTGLANTLAGNDIINGESGNSIPDVEVPDPKAGIFNTGTINTEGGNDKLTGIFNDLTNNSSTGYGIYNVEGVIDTGEGNDILTGIGIDRGIFGQSGTLNTGNGNDIITGTGFFGIENNWDTFNTGDGSDIITGIGTKFGGILNYGPINTGADDDIIRGTTMSGSGIENIANGSIDTGDGNDIIMAIGNAYILYNVGTINTGNGNDFIIAEENGLLPLYISYISVNGGTINTGSGNDSIILQGGLHNSGGVFLGDGNDSLALTASKVFPNYALDNSNTIDTGDGDDIITSIGVIYNEGVIETGNGDDSIIVNSTGTGYGIYNNGGAINMGDGNDSIIANEGFESGPNSSGAWFLGEGDDYIKGYGSGDFYGGNGNDTLELTPGTYTVGIWGEAGESPIFTKGNQLMITSEFEKLKAGSTIYDFTSLTAGQIIIVA